MVKGFEEITHELNEEEFRAKDIIIKLLLSFKNTNETLTNFDIKNYLLSYNIKLQPYRIRKIIHYIRKHSQISLLLANSKGYYISNDMQEVRNYIQSLEERIKSISEIHLAISKQYEKQIRIDKKN